MACNINIMVSRYLIALISDEYAELDRGLVSEAARGME
jgi:hypothetical protein